MRLQCMRRISSLGQWAALAGRGVRKPLRFHDLSTLGRRARGLRLMAHRVEQDIDS